MKRKAILLKCALPATALAAATCFGSAPAAAQITCNEGWHPVMRQDGVWQCGADLYVPPPKAIPPGMDPRNLPPPDPNVEGLWGSLVVAPDQRIFWSYGRRDRESAEQTALDRCRSDQAANMDGCRILNTGQTVDVALAFDGTSYFVGRVVGYDKAMKKALKACQAGSHADRCRIALLYSPVGGAVPDDVAKVVYGL